MLLVVHNLTDDTLTIGFDKTGKPPDHEVSAAHSQDIQMPKVFSSLVYITGDSLRTETASERYTIRLGTGSRTWRRVTSKPDANQWQMYCIRVSRGRYKLLVFRRRNPSTFLSDMPDSLPLSSLALPGTHDSMAFHGWPISQCQLLSTPLPVQFHSGIRVIDVRLGVRDSKLVAFHGIFFEKTPFQDILSAVHDFLTAPLTQRETIVMSIKQEDFATTPPPTFSSMVHKEIVDGPGGIDMWFLDNRIPKLGEVRGKVIMFSRFGGDGSGWDRGLEGMGIHPSTWPDSSRDGFEWTCKDTLVRTRDWYNINTFLSIPEKFSMSTSILLASTNTTTTPTLAISYLSGSSFPLALPPVVARGMGWPSVGLGFHGINALVGQWLLSLLDGIAAPNTSSSDSGKEAGDKASVGSNEPRVRGWVMMDFCGDRDNALMPLLVECNFRGRNAGEEGWA